MKTIVIILVALALTAGAVGGLAFAFSRGGGFSSGVGTEVRVEPAAKGRLIEVVNAPGEITAKTKVSISAKVAARIAELPFKEGETVTKGDPRANPPVAPSVLVRLDAKDLEAGLRSVTARYNGQAAEQKVAAARITAQEAQLESSKVTLADAERTLRRQLQLYETRDVSQQEVEQAQAKVDQLKAEFRAAENSLRADRANLLVLQHQMEAAEAEIAQSREALSYAVIHSPIDGVITKLNAQVGELVVTGILNTPGTTIMDVADLSKMLLVARVDESSIASVKVGQKALIRAQAYPSETFTGTVETVALANTEATDGSKFYEVKILIDTKGRRILSGLTADVDIATQVHENVLRVPSQAVLSRAVDDLPPEIRSAPEVNQGKTFVTVVYRMQNGKAVVTPVRVGPSDLTHTIIRSGVAEGDQVIVGPYKVLEDISHNMLVKLATSAATQPAK